MFKRKLKTEKGQAIIFIAIAIVGLVGFTALSIDGGLAFSDRRHAQNAADTAAMAAALSKLRGEDFNNTALTIAAANGYDNDGTSNIITITTANSPNGECPDTGTDITVEITSHVPTTFAPVLGVSELTNNVMAASRACDIHTVGGSPLSNGNSVFATKSDENCSGNHASIRVSGSAQLQIWGGNIGAASTNGACLSFKGGDVQLKKEESGPACSDIVTAASSGGTFNHVNGEDECGNKYYNQTFDPLPGDLGITCTGTATKSGSSMSPGNYTGTFPPNGVSTLSPGTYCIDGDFKVQTGSLTGNGVTIVMNTGGIHWTGNTEVNLSAPTNGDYAGLVIYAPPSNNSNDMILNGSGDFRVTGTVLAQNSDCNYSGDGKIEKNTVQFICYTWESTGNSDIEIEWDASKLFSPETVEAPTISLLQ